MAENNDVVVINDVKEHDIWTHRESGNDYAVQSIGYHTEHAELTVAFVSFNGSVFYMSLEKFVEDHELTHRIYRDFE